MEFVIVPLPANVLEPDLNARRVEDFTRDRLNEDKIDTKKGKLWPRKSIYRFITPFTIHLILKPWLGKDMAPNDLRKLANSIANLSVKLFTLLLLVEGKLKGKAAPRAKIKHIRKFLEADINDSIFSNWGDRTSSGIRQAYGDRLNEDELLSIDCVLAREWDIAPTFRQAIHGEEAFPQDFRPPFIEEDHDNDWNGSYGHCYEVKIAGHHLEVLRDGRHTPVREDSWCICKRVRLTEDNRVEARREADILNDLVRRKHSNVVELWASFEALKCYGQGTESHLYLFFPKAEYDMKHWLYLKEAPEYLSNLKVEDQGIGSLVDQRRRRHAYDTMDSIVEGLTVLHKEVNSAVMLHHDLKPGSILLFLEDGRPVWRICDFGNSKLRYLDEQGTRTAVVGTYMYQAPEYESNNDLSLNVHGRAFDDFALGCIMLEVATVLVWGWEEQKIRVFQQERKDNTRGCRRKVDSKLSSVEDDSFHNNMPAVLQWLQHLRARDGSKKLNRVLDVVAGLLAEEVSARLLSWEARLDLWEAHHDDAGRDDLESYTRKYVQSPPKDLQQSYSNPLIRALCAKKGSRAVCLRAEGWSEKGMSDSMKVVRTASLRAEVNGCAYSTIPRAFEHMKMIGREKILDNLVKEFANGTCTRVGLHGRVGIGKSRIAHHFLNQIHKRQLQAFQHIRHTIWISGASFTTLIDGYRKLAVTVGIPLDDSVAEYSGPKELHPLIEEAHRWLQNDDNKPWMMVIDGLVGDQFSIVENPDKGEAHVKSIHMFLPPPGAGLVLITTRNRADIDFWTDECVQVGDMDARDALELFNTASRTRTLTPEDYKKLPDLLEYLASPQLIEMAARYIERGAIGGTSVSSLMYMLENGPQRLDWLSRRIKSYDLSPGGAPNASIRSDLDLRLIAVMLDPLLRQRPESPQGKAAALLESISLLSKHNVDRELLEFKYDVGGLAAFPEHLNILGQYSLLSARDPSGYFIHELLQDCVLLWQLNHTEDTKILLSLDEILCMLQKRYKQLKTRNPSRTSWTIKLDLLPHIDRIILCLKSLGSDTQKRLKRMKCVRYSFRAARSVVTFSRELRWQGRFDDAIILLETFTRVTLRPREKEELLNREVRADLFRALAETYTERASGPESKVDYRRALEHTESARTLDPEGWRLKLDEVNLLGKLERIADADECLTALENSLSDGRITSFSGKLVREDHGEWHKAISRILSERLRLEHQCRIQGYKNIDNTKAKNSRYQLLEACKDTYKKILHKVDTDEDGYLDALIDLAANYEQDPNSRKVALELYREVLEILDSKDKDPRNAGETNGATGPFAQVQHQNMRIWDAKSNVGVGLLSLQEYKDAKEILQGVFDHHYGILGERHGRTRENAYVLRLAMLGCKDIEAYKELEKRFNGNKSPLLKLSQKTLQDNGICLREDELARIGLMA